MAGTYLYPRKVIKNKELSPKKTKNWIFKNVLLTAGLSLLLSTLIKRQLF